MLKLNCDAERVCESVCDETGCVCVCLEIQLRQHFSVSGAAKDSPACVSAASCGNSSSRTSTSEPVCVTQSTCGRYTLNNNEV